MSVVDRRSDLLKSGDWVKVELEILDINPKTNLLKVRPISDSPDAKQPEFEIRAGQVWRIPKH